MLAFLGVAQDRSESVDVLIGFRSQPGHAEETLVRGVGGQVCHSYHLVSVIAATAPRSQPSNSPCH